MDKQIELKQRSEEIEAPYLPNFDSGSLQRRNSPSVPSAGTSLASATALRAKSIRNAVAVLRQALAKRELRETFTSMFEPRWRSVVYADHSTSTLINRAAWNVVGLWLLAQASHEVKPSCSLTEAERWFLGSVRPPHGLITEMLDAESSWRAQQFLSALNLDMDFWELLPYIMEEHGPGSRASVMRDPSTAVSRARKKSQGVFYTPTDVADFMVTRIMQNYKSQKNLAKCLDPACGTGVFLLAFLRYMEASSTSQFDRFSYTCSSLFGADISAQALDAAGFVLLRECLSDAQAQGLSPWAAWHSIRLNLVQVDALKIEPPTLKLSEQALLTKKRLLIRRAELATVPSRYCAAEVEPIEPTDLDQSEFGVLFMQKSMQIGQLFPDVASGFDLVVGNPPYTSLGERDDESWLIGNYQSVARVERSYNTFILFIEMMWRLTKPGSNASALVTPLSIAFHRGTQYQACRRAMTLNGGRWEFAFFDRQPHALFGEEVKTRNAILFRLENWQTPARGARAEIATGPLRKWTSRTRKYLFDNIDFVSLGDANIGRCIPKLQNENQARVFRALSNRLDRLPSLSSKITKCLPSEIFIDYDSPRVFVGGTAYNFLNVYRELSIEYEEADLPLSESAIHCLEFKSQRDAQACFAILSSRLSFWLWHVLGDGFHVGGWLFNEIPIGRQTFNETEYDNLSSIGHNLWEKLKEHRFTSRNGGKRTIGFRPLACNQEISAIDDLIIRTLRLPEPFKDELRVFVKNNAVVDSTDQRRNHLQHYFSASQSK
jgi:hypothetical protein